MIWATADIESSRLLEYIDRGRHATGQHVTPAHLAGRAAGKVFGSFLASPSGSVRPSVRPLDREGSRR